MNSLTLEQRQRYSRTIMLPHMGEQAQQRLLDSHVLIIGAGALGSITSMYLCASGVGHLHIHDFDNIDISNLQRQLSFTTNDVGRKKVETLAQRLAAINPDVKVEASTKIVTTANIEQIAGKADLIIEASDNPATKYMVTDTAHKLGIPCVLGGIAEYAGQLFTQLPDDNDISMYRRVFGDRPHDNAMTPCRTGGILGPLPGVIASLQAAEAIKLLTSTGHTCSDSILIIDALNMAVTTLRI